MKPIETKYACNVLADTRQGGRPENQDTCAWGDTRYGLLVTVCDGMGGGPSGKMASATAANRLVQYVTEYTDTCDRKQLLADAVQAANQAVYEMAQENPALKGMGTTVTAILINDQSAIVAHVGDSRIYQLRHGRKVFRTWDHSRVFEGLKTGMYKNEEECRLSPESNIIIRAVGTLDHVKVDVKELPYEKGDRFMLCTDGIWGAFPEKEIIAMAAKTAYLAGAVESLVVRVDEVGMLSGGHHDNLTLAMLETKKDSILKEEMSTKQRRLLIALGALCAVSLLLNVILIATRPGKTRKGGKTETEQIDVKHIVDSLNALNDERLANLEARLEKKQSQMIDDLKRQSKEDDVSTAITKLFENYDELESLRSSLDDLIKKLNQLKNMPASSDKDKGVDEIINTFNTLATENKQLDKVKVNKVKELLGNPITKKDDRKDPDGHVLGQYKAIIDLIRELKLEL